MRYSKTIAITGLYCQLFFLFIFTLMHFIRLDKSALASFVSEYAVGNYGWLMTLGFFGMAIGTLCLIIGLLNNIKVSKTAIFTLGVWCTGAFLFSIFTTDIPGTPATLQGLIHAFSALIALLSLSIAMISWAFTFRKNDAWHQMANTSRFFGVISIVLFIVLFLSPLSLKGLAERILIIWDVYWIILVNRQLYINSIQN